MEQKPLKCVGIKKTNWEGRQTDTTEVAISKEVGPDKGKENKNKRENKRAIQKKEKE